MEIKTGVTIPVERNGGVVGAIFFDPSDVLFAERIYGLIEEMEQAEKDFERRAGALEADGEVDSLGLPKNARERLTLLREICIDMHGKIDGVFGTGTSEMLFGGALSVEAIGQFFEELAPYMENARAERIEKYMNREQRRALRK